jgi:hypothetical protein
MRVTFRAQFSSPIGVLNPTGWKASKPFPFTIEVRRHGTNWMAWTLDRHQKPYGALDRLGHAPTHGTMKDLVTQVFEHQHSEWSMFDSDGKLLDPDTILEDPQGNFSKRIFTHLPDLDKTSTGPGPYFRTHCGLTEHSRQLRSRKGQTPPDCKQCKAEWERLKREVLK